MSEKPSRRRFVLNLGTTGLAAGSLGLLVALARSVVPDVPGPEQYAMLGLPFEATNGDAGAAFGDELGPYDPTKWRLASFDPAI